MAQALLQVDEPAITARVGQHADGEQGEQLTLSDGWTVTLRARSARRTQPLCAGCREREARYGFRDEQGADPAERPRTLCFECFRVEISRRQAVAARLARGWNAEQVRLPLEETLKALTTRRRRAQIAARHALGA